MSSNSHAGRPKSWISVTVIVIGFVIGALALPLGPNWLLFWIGTGIVVVGGVFAMSVDIMSDVIVDEQHK